MNEEVKTQAAARTGSLQPQASGAREVEKQKLRREVEAVRRGYTTGGYCETEKLQEKEKPLAKLLAQELDELKQKHGYSPDPKFKHPEIRAVEVELNGLSWKPQLVVKGEN